MSGTGPNQPSAATLTAVSLTVTLAVVNRRRLTKAYRRDLDAAEETRADRARAVALPDHRAGTDHRRPEQTRQRARSTS